MVKRTTMMDRAISISKKSRAIPRTLPKEKIGESILLSIGSHEIG
jgi:hypothetical protein